MGAARLAVNESPTLFLPEFKASVRITLISLPDGMITGSIFLGAGAGAGTSSFTAAAVAGTGTGVGTGVGTGIGAAGVDAVSGVVALSLALGSVLALATTGF